MSLLHRMSKVRFETKQEGLRLCFGGKELPSGMDLDLKMGQKWVLGSYIFDPNTNSHYLETKDRRYQLDIDSKLRIVPLHRSPLPLPLIIFFYLLDIWYAVTRDLRLYWRQRRNNRKSE